MEYNNIMMLLAILPATWTFISIVNFFAQERKPLSKDSSRNYKVPSSKLLSLQRPERGDKVGIFLKIILCFSSAPLLFFDGFFVYLWVTGQFTSPIDIGSIIFLFFMIALPLWVLTDIFILEPRTRKKGKTKVAETATIELEGNIGILFEHCQKVLFDMGASIAELDFKSKFIKADLGRQVMTITIEQTEQLCNKVSILSDSKLLSVKFDFGRNRRNIDIFMKRLLYREDD